MVCVARAISDYAYPLLSTIIFLKWMKLMILILRWIKAIQSRWRNWYYRSLGVKLQGYVGLADIEITRNFSDIELEAHCSLDKGVVLLSSGLPSGHPKIYVGTGTYINRNTFLDASLSLRIGRHCAIGPGCYLTDHDHGYQVGLAPLEQPLVSKPTEICDRVWLGANVVVLKGVTIGENAIVGAGSVVTKDIPARTVSVGVPSRIIRYLDQPVIQAVCKL
jgi:acetyltransferase-like isoleucine patch superfamily enzyme